MQPRTLQQVYSELDTVFTPQIDLIRQRQQAIPGQVQAEENGLRAQEQDYFDNTIMTGARRRGLGFSGIPEGERARYGATQFMPALARLRQGAREQATSLEEAILGINERRSTMGQQIFSQEQQMAEQRRQFDENLRFQREQMAAQQRAASAAAGGGGIGGYIGGGGANIPAGGTQQPAAGGGAKAAYGFKNGKNGAGGFWFTDANGRAISAATYAQLTGANLAQLLNKMAASGDRGAAAALKGPGVNTNAASYKALSWR